MLAQPLRVAVATLGCKVNRADADALLSELQELACEVAFDQTADLYIVNTCTVTATADRQSRQLVYRARRCNPEARVILTGCLARVDPRAAASIHGVDRVFSLAQHAQLVEYVRTLVAGGSGVARPADAPFALGHTDGERARPFLKVQDGCDAACAYCIVPRARGPSRSVAPETVRRSLGALAGQGFEEVVLAGIHLGQYGRDLDPPTDLSDLLRCCQGLTRRLRLSSLEPVEITEELLQLLAGASWICPHLHLPIQSGDDEILRRMNRAYRATDVLQVLQNARARLPHAALGADFITGFPGETEEQFARTLAFVEESPLTYLHVFPFSARPGTPAARFEGQVPSQVSRDRADRLRLAGRRKLAEFASRQVGALRQVLIERCPSSEGGGVVSGVTENYLRAQVRAGPGARPGGLLLARIERARGGALDGQTVTEPC